MIIILNHYALFFFFFFFLGRTHSAVCYRNRLEVVSLNSCDYFLYFHYGSPAILGDLNNPLVPTRNLSPTKLAVFRHVLSLLHRGNLVLPGCILRLSRIVLDYI